MRVENLCKVMRKVGRKNGFLSIGSASDRAVILVLFAFFASSVVSAQSIAGRWTEERANQWFEEKGWPVGCNYVPSTAINTIEMWQAETFDAKTINREMGWAEKLGFNTMRIFLNALVYESAPEGFKSRFDEVLGILAKHKMRALVTFFTNGGNPDGRLGKQMDAVQGLHSPGWKQSPGMDIVNDPTKWGGIERYVKDILTTHKDDDRILMWCLYNEPENLQGGKVNTLPLLRAVFQWAREVNPSQPLTAPMWGIPCQADWGSNLPIVCFLGENCDVMSFHCYESTDVMKKFINYLKQFRRPLVCTEYLARTQGNTFESCLPLLRHENVGAISFGLVQGKCGFYYPWSSKEGSPEPPVWFHDILRSDGTPYSKAEVDFVKSITKP